MFFSVNLIEFFRIAVLHDFFRETASHFVVGLRLPNLIGDIFISRVTTKSTYFEVKEKSI